jgi:hypothetical protein
VLNRNEKRPVLVAVLALSLFSITAWAAEEHESEAAASSDAFKVLTYRNWLFRSFLPNEKDDADTLGFELVSGWGMGNYDVTNISYLELDDYPRGVPGLPPGNPGSTSTVAATGINDLLSAFLFSKKGHHGPHHWGFGFATQLPTGSGDTLSSGKYSLGPAIDYEYSNDKLFIAIVALQLWSVAGDSDKSDVNMLMIKPMVTYDFHEKWKAVYMPYGISVYWDKPSGQQVYLPLGGGVQRQFDIGSHPSAFSVQLFRNVLRPDKGAEHDFRLMFEVNF